MIHSCAAFSFFQRIVASQQEFIKLGFKSSASNVFQLNTFTRRPMPGVTRNTKENHKSRHCARSFRFTDMNSSQQTTSGRCSCNLGAPSDQQRNSARSKNANTADGKSYVMCAPTCRTCWRLHSALCAHCRRFMCTSVFFQSLHRSFPKPFTWPSGHTNTRAVQSEVPAFPTN